MWTRPRLLLKLGYWDAFAVEQCGLRLFRASIPGRVLEHRAFVRPDVPDVAGVFQHRAVAGKFADAGDIEDRLAAPDFVFLVLL